MDENHSNGSNSINRYDIANRSNLEEFKDIISGYKFYATISWTTPLKVLERHGEIHEGKDLPPCITDDMSQGIWIATSNDWPIEIGMSDDFIHKYEEMKSKATMASMFGQIHQSGGIYIEVLKSIRKIIESPKSPSEKRESLEQYFYSSTWKNCPNNSFLAERILLFEIPHFLDTIKGLRKSSKQLLLESNLRTPNNLLEFGLKNIAAIKGIGLKMANVIYEAALASKSRDEEFVCKYDALRT